MRIMVVYSFWMFCVLQAVLNGEETFRRVRVASISFRPVKLDLAGNTDKLESMFRQAARGGAKISVAPEGILEGYIVNEIIADKFDQDRMRQVAVTIDSPTIRRFRDLAEELDMCLVFGFAEKVGEDVFNSAIFIDNEGKVCGKYHKMQLAEGYHPAWWFNRLGRQSRAFDTPYGRCGVLICNDRWNPLLAQIPALDGAQFLVIPSFGSTSKAQDEAVLARGVENHLPVVEANVGVSLIVSDDKIVSLRREVEGVTFGEISIPASKPIDAESRDRVEADFKQWRDVEMPARLAKTLRRVGPRGEARDRDYVRLKTSQLEVIVGNNKSVELDDLPHRAGYNGIFRLTSKDQPESPFVPAYAGWNLEHYFDARPRQQDEKFFEPRYARMECKSVGDHAAELYQPATPTYHVESWTHFEVKEPHYVDFTYRCVPRAHNYKGNFLGVFWASYINGPLDKSLYFLDGESTLSKPLWRQLCAQQHNRDSTVRNVNDSTTLSFAESDTLFANESPLRYSVPCFYGRFRNMVLIYVFKPNPNLRFTHSPSGGGISQQGDDTNPAWDFQLIVPNPQQGREYRLEGRLVYKPWIGREDVRAEVAAFLQDQTE